MKYYAQFGEDKYIAETYKLPENGCFIDVGAADGIKLSNTKYFENLGWRGVCLEPNPIDYMKCRVARNFTLPLAVGSVEGARKFYFNEAIPTHSGFIKKPNAPHTEIDVMTVRLDSLIKFLGIKQIDLLSIDTEGTEIDVLNSFDLRVHRPSIIIVEYITEKVVNMALKDCMSQFSDIYRLNKELGANLVYVKND